MIVKVFLGKLVPKSLNSKKTGKEVLYEQKYYRPVKICCAIGDEKVDGRPYKEIVEIAREYIKEIGGFEKFAEWGFMPR